MFRKAQAAMEFLMTYGWALLAVLVVIGALAYLGVLDVEILLPERCTFPVPLNCEDHVVNEDNIQVVLLNGAGRGINVRSIIAESEAFDADGSGDNNYRCIWTPKTGSTVASPGTFQLLKNGDSETFTLNIKVPYDTRFGLTKVSGSDNVGQYTSESRERIAGNPAAARAAPTGTQLFGAAGAAAVDTPLNGNLLGVINVSSGTDDSAADGVIVFGSTDISDNCGYNDVGRGKNKYSVTVYYTWSDSRAILHKVGGEMFTAAPG